MREVYFNLIETERKKMAHTKRTKKKGMVREDRRLQLKVSGKKPILTVEKSRRKVHHFRPGTKALLKIRKFQKPTHLLIPKWPFHSVVKEVLQARRPWL